MPAQPFEWPLHGPVRASPTKTLHAGQAISASRRILAYCLNDPLSVNRRRFQCQPLGDIIVGLLKLQFHSQPLSDVMLILRVIRLGSQNPFAIPMCRMRSSEDINDFRQNSPCPTYDEMTHVFP